MSVNPGAIAAKEVREEKLGCQGRGRRGGGLQSDDAFVENVAEMASKRLARDGNFLARRPARRLADRFAVLVANGCGGCSRFSRFVFGLSDF